MTIEALILVVVLVIAAAVAVLVVLARRHDRQYQQVNAHCAETRAAVCRLDGRIDTLDARCATDYATVHTRLARVETRS